MYTILLHTSPISITLPLVWEHGENRLPISLERQINLTGYQGRALYSLSVCSCRLGKKIYRLISQRMNFELWNQTKLFFPCDLGIQKSHPITEFF